MLLHVDLLIARLSALEGTWGGPFTRCPVSLLWGASAGLCSVCGSTWHVIIIPWVCLRSLPNSLQTLQRRLQLPVRSVMSSFPVMCKWKSYLWLRFHVVYWFLSFGAKFRNLDCDFLESFLCWNHPDVESNFYFLKWWKIQAWFNFLSFTIGFGLQWLHWLFSCYCTFFTFLVYP